MLFFLPFDTRDLVYIKPVVFEDLKHRQREGQ